VPVVHLLPFGNVALLRVARVVKTGIVGLPGDTGRARSLNVVRQQLPRRRLNHVQCAELRAAWRSPIGNILAVVGGEPPIECDSSVGRQLVRIYEHPVFALEAVANIENGLVLHPFPTSEKVILAADLWHADAANGQQLFEALLDLGASRGSTSRMLRV